MSYPLAELLREENLITDEQLTSADENFEKTRESHHIFLLRSKAVQEKKVLELFCKRYRIQPFDLSNYTIEPEALGLLSEDDVRRFSIIPVEKTANSLIVAIADPLALQNLDDVKFLTQLNVEAVFVVFSAFEKAVEKYYSSQQAIEDIEDMNDMENAPVEEEVDSELDGIGNQNIEIMDGSGDRIDAPIIKLVNSILINSVQKKASDIHVEPYQNIFRIRMRVDGTLVETIRPPYKTRNAVVARLKIMAKMDIAEKRLPQDGKIKIRTKYGEMDFRVSSMPTVNGEKVVLRLLDKSGLETDLTALGFSEEEYKLFHRSIYESNGMLLVTGPTGSGKTTTLYSALAERNKPSENISTAEDPVEYNLEGINQCQTHADIGLNFAKTLRTFLRQDPDIILVGEIRDLETAEVAIQAALTGHLVFSTLHTNDAPSTITRFLNMGIEPFLVTASVRTIIAQRLLRSICSSCKEEISVPVERLIELGIDKEAANTVKIFQGKGCSECDNSGYKGRFAVFEIMDFTTRLKEAVLKGANAIELKKLALEGGMTTLRMNALKNTFRGKTTLEEAIGNTSNDL